MKWYKCYRDWAKFRGKNLQIVTLSPQELDQILQLFFTEVRRKDVKVYEPCSLASLHAGIDRYLRDKK